MEQKISYDKFIDLLDKSIKTNDIQQLLNLLSSIDKYEEIFLKNYQKRKKEGVYYTKKNITEFIIKEALLLFLNKNLNLNNKNLIEIQNYEDIFKLNLNFRKKIYETLLNTSICDPACGSGAFLVSSAVLLFEIIKKLNPKGTNIEIKKDLLKNLYGYDINEYAVELSILKLIQWYFEEGSTDVSEILSQLRSNIKSENSLIKSNLSKYDIIVGNPPYGNILKNYEKELLKGQEIFYQDIYCTFLLKALDWTDNIIGFLVPKSFLLRQGYIKFRNKLLSEANIVKIFDIGSKLFKNATNEVQIILYEKKNQNDSKTLNIYEFPKNLINSYKNQEVDSLKICYNIKCPMNLKSKKLYVYTNRKDCPYCNSPTIELNRIRIKPDPFIFKLISKIERIGDLNYLNPIKFPKLIRGEEDKGLIIIRKKLRRDTSGSCLFLSARNDFNYYYIKRNKSVNLEEINANSLKGNNFEYYTNPKLLIKHNNIIPETIYTNNNVCFTSSIYSLLHDDIKELQYLSAVLNSSLIQFYCIYAINNQKDTTINLNQYMIRHLPIVNPPDQLKLKLTENVKIINKLFKDNEGVITQNIRQVIKEIDDSIFNLYSIKENEKKMIISDVKKRIKFFENVYK
ncbi:MAG: Eco57I restriction-modification methylase domain-containing protein [Candidatus Hodarchaeota archaeon]